MLKSGLHLQRVSSLAHPLSMIVWQVSLHIMLILLLLEELSAWEAAITSKAEARRVEMMVEKCITTKDMWF
jgi:hypothetical protein